VIFDLDGVVMDAATLHAEGWQLLPEELPADPRAGGPGAHDSFDVVVRNRRTSRDA
jgi:hypothetical protein